MPRGFGINKIVAETLFATIRYSIGQDSTKKFLRESQYAAPKTQCGYHGEEVM